MLSNKEREVVKLYAMLELTERKKPQDSRLWHEWRRHRHELRQEIKKVSPSYLRVLRHRIRKKIRGTYYDMALTELADSKMGIGTSWFRDERVGFILFDALASPGEQVERDEILDFYEDGYTMDREDDPSSLKELFSPSED